MTDPELVRGIRKVWELAKIVGLDQEFVGPVALQASEEFKKVSISPSSSYEELFLEGLQGSQYNILLADYAYFQFGFGNDGGARFAYYPNPFIGASRPALAELGEMRQYVEEGIMDIDTFLHRISEIRYSRHPPMLRYEYSLSQYVKLVHPCSHLHIGFHSENRWPVRRELTPVAFSLTTFKLFYSDLWSTAVRSRAGRRARTVDQELAAAKKDCRLLLEDEFSNEEACQFYFD